MIDPRQLGWQVPGNWSSIRAKFLFPQKNVKGFPSEDPLSASQRFGVVSQRMLEQELDSRFMTAFNGLENFKLVEPNDFVISLRSFQGGIERSMSRGIISPAYTVMSPSEKVHPNYFRYYLKERGFVSRLNGVITGIRDGKTVKYEEFGELAAPLPPLEIQKAIADYLDEKTTDLDALIEKKGKLLDLLAEERAALINQAVTKGLDPSVPMKDSGIPWIGEMPAHWRIGKTKWYCGVRDGTHDTPIYLEESDETYPLITSINFVDDAIDFSTAKHISANDHRQICKRSNTSQGDVLMSMIGGNIGKTVIVKTDKDFSIKNVGLFKTSGDEILGHFLFYILKSSILQVEIDLSSRGGAQGFLGLQNLRDILFPCIPRSEMTEIVAFLDQEIGKLTISAAKLQTQLDRLQEYRQALITAAVTGQLDIGAAA